MTEHQPKMLPKPVMKDTPHAILGASSSHRWIPCPASVRMERMFPDTTSSYAEEGTIAHELAAYCLIHGCRASEAPPNMGWEPTVMKDVDMWNPEMREHVQEYIDFVLLVPGDLLVETRVDYSKWAEKGFGTSDAIRVSVPERRARVIDLKYGTGVKVYAEKNTQGMLYALGVLNELDYIYGDSIDVFEIIIHQTRLDHVDRWEVTRDELLKWAEDVVVPAAREAMSETSRFNPGEKQCGFCRARAHCKARAEWNMKLALETFGTLPSPETLTLDEVAQILGRADEFRAWIKSIEDRAYEDATKSNVQFPGWKLVEGRSVRKINNPEMLATALDLEGYEPDQIYEPREIIGLGKLEKLLGKKHPLIKEFTFRPTGSPSLVPESDKRPALQTTTAQEAFQHVDDL